LLFCDTTLKINFSKNFYNRKEYLENDFFIEKRILAGDNKNFDIYDNINCGWF